jgi:hypothetical protein
LKIARNLIAGVCAERFDPDFREGSSLDEVVMSQLIGGEAAKLLNVDPRTFWNKEVHEHVFHKLNQHRAVVKISPITS